MSEQTPHISELLTELWPQYMDEDMYQIVNGAIPETTALLDLQWDHSTYACSIQISRSEADVRPFNPYSIVHREQDRRQGGSSSSGQASHSYDAGAWWPKSGLF